MNSLPESAELEQQRGKLALQILLLLERGEREHALQRVDELQLLMHESFKLKSKEYWPEMHLIARGLQRHFAEKVIGGLITDLFQQRLSLKLDRLWQNHILSLSREYEAILHGLVDPRTSPNAGLERWRPVTRTIAEFRGAGSPQTRWTFNNEKILTLGSGQSEDYLFYQSPLAGDYEVHCKMSEYGISQVMTQGTFVGPKGDGQQTTIGTYRTGSRNEPISYPVIRHDVTVHYRAVVEDRTTRVTINGQPITEYSTTDAPDSWVSIHSLSNSNTAFHNFQIGGNPTIPDEVVMTTANDLACWIPYDLGTKERTWSRIEDTDGRGLIYGSRNTDLAGSYLEALLRYHRPLWEDGSIEYEFFYNPDRMDAHPALDRLVFLLNPDGVRLHWITDGEHDRTEVPPENVIDEPENHRGPEQLPFNLNNWNQVKLSLEGSQVSLELNGQLIYQRELESTNHRTFGLFHYADRTELLARNLVMRGDWPKTLPRLSDQELADPALVAAERNLEKLKTGFHHDFARDGLPIPMFTYTGANPADKHNIVPGGVRATMQNATDFEGVAMIPRFSLQGDFDVQAEIDELDFTESGVEGGALLDLKLDDEMQHYLRIMRCGRNDFGEHLNAVISPLHSNGRRSYLGKREPEASPGGILRIARLGDRILFMFAEKDSRVFRTIREETISNADVLMHGIQLKTSLRDGRRSSVLWKN
ncbi:MAG TPA: DUF1583 domain-containing protein, partial [Planctomycetaceae bacterium]|nr:DUF1583 domain-containing protein [Planctomycetaceae bacterium]